MDQALRRAPLSPTPLGLYFAKLWYDEELYPLVFALEGLAHAIKALPMGDAVAG
jgi:hypothetical protein